MYSRGKEETPEIHRVDVEWKEGHVNAKLDVTLAMTSLTVPTRTICMYQALYVWKMLTWDFCPRLWFCSHHLSIILLRNEIFKWNCHFLTEIWRVILVMPNYQAWHSVSEPGKAPSRAYFVTSASGSTNSPINKSMVQWLKTNTSAPVKPLLPNKAPQ